MYYDDSCKVTALKLVDVHGVGCRSLADRPIFSDRNENLGVVSRLHRSSYNNLLMFDEQLWSAVLVHSSRHFPPGKRLHLAACRSSVQLDTGSSVPGGVTAMERTLS